MDDEEIALINVCTNLVSLKKAEAFPWQLLVNKRSGEWVAVRDLCLQIGLSQGVVKPELYATWLPDPAGLEGYVVIAFYDDDSKWSMCAHYNRMRLLGGATANQNRVLIGDGITGSASRPMVDSVEV